MANIGDKGGILQLSLWEDATQEMNLHESKDSAYSQKHLCARTTYGRNSGAISPPSCCQQILNY